MWKLVKEDGTVFRDGFKSQWAALITSKKEDGSCYKKKDAEQAKSGCWVYKDWTESEVCAYSQSKGDGSFDGVFHKKVYRSKKIKLMLVKY